MSAIIMWCLAHLNYWTIILFMAVESSFIPFPSEVVVPPAAWLAANGENGLNIVGVIIAATLGADIGATINYVLAKLLGRPIVYAFARSKMGHICLINEEKVKHAETFFEHHGACRKAVDFHSCRFGKHALRQVYSFHHSRRGCMEHCACHNRLFAVKSARNEKHGGYCQSFCQIQPHHRLCNSCHCGCGVVGDYYQGDKQKA